jgi:hypothetical protein
MSRGRRGDLRTTTTVLATALLVASCTGTGQVQETGQTPADVAYCQKLATAYEYYIGRSEWSARDDVRRGNLDAQVAASRCRSGTADSIRVLERELRNNGFALPPRG